MDNKRLFFLNTFIILSLLGFNSGYASYSEDGLTRPQARGIIASALFNITLESIDIDLVGANYDYNDWGESPASTPNCLGYDDGHSGIDIQTKDVAGIKTTDRIFYSLSGGEVINAGESISKTIAIYDNINDRTILYLHARSVLVNNGDIVEFGDALGVQGNSGLGFDDQNTNEHVHIEVQTGMKTTAACGAPYTLDPVNILYDIIVNTPLWDVQNKSAWFLSYVHCLYGLGIISEDQDGRFKPLETVNRVELIEMVVLALELTLGHKLPEVCIYPVPWNMDPSQWYYTYMTKAYLYKNYSVLPPESIAFWDPNQSLNFLQGVTREEAAHIVRNALCLPSYSSTGVPPFTDVPIISTYASWVHKIWEVEIIDGYKDNTFKPDEILNRAVAAKMIRNMLKYKGYLNNNCNVCPEICNKD